jgi:peptidylprolyl isomerase
MSKTKKNNDTENNSGKSPQKKENVGSKSIPLKVQGKKPPKVDKGHSVSVEYVGTLDNGEEFDNSKGHGPLKFTVGKGHVIKGFDDAVMGMKVNESKKFTIPKHEAYGDKNPALVQKIPMDKIPSHLKPQVKQGGFLVMQAPTGQQVPAKVESVTDKEVTLDLNHPLAGKDLTFDIKIVDISHDSGEHHGHGSHGCGKEDCQCGDEGCGDENCACEK